MPWKGKKTQEGLAHFLSLLLRKKEKADQQEFKYGYYKKCFYDNWFLWVYIGKRAVNKRFITGLNWRQGAIPLVTSHLKQDMPAVKYVNKLKYSHKRPIPRRLLKYLWSKVEYHDSLRGRFIDDQFSISDSVPVSPFIYSEKHDEYRTRYIQALHFRQKITGKLSSSGQTLLISSC